jgi:hypothetical protein
LASQVDRIFWNGAKSVNNKNAFVKMGSTEMPETLESAFVE